MKLSLVERETILLYNQAEPMAEIYTHDPRLMEKLDLLAKKHPDQITRKDAHNFTVPKRCVSVREPYSAERRKAASERAKAAGYQPPMRKSDSYISRHGCVRVEFDQDFHYCSGEVCHTPKELFDLLADDYRTYLEIELTKGKREVTEDDEREADALCKQYLERWKEEQK